MDEEAPTLQVEEIVVEDVETTNLTPKPEIPDTGYLPLQDFLGMAKVDDEDKEKLTFIWNFYQKGRDRAETIEEIKKVIYRLGNPPMGDNQLHRLYVYTRLKDESRSINKEIRQYESDSPVADTRP